LRQTASTKGLPYGRIVELQEAGHLSKLIELIKNNPQIDMVLTANWLAKNWASDEQLIDFITTVNQNNLPAGEANQLYELTLHSPKLPHELIDQIEKIDIAAIEKAVAEVLMAHPEAVAEYKTGEKKVVGFLMGQIMNQLKGKGDAGSIKSVLDKILDETRTTI